MGEEFDMAKLGASSVWYLVKLVSPVKESCVNINGVDLIKICMNYEVPIMQDLLGSIHDVHN